MIPPVVQSKPKNQCAARAMIPAVANVPSTPRLVIGSAAARNRTQPTCIPPSNRIATRATTAIRSTSTVESRARRGQMSEAPAAATRKSAGAGTGKSSVSLCAPSASENEPATTRTIRPKSVSSLIPVLSHPVSTYSLVSDLPVRIDACELEGLERAVSSDFVRRTTVIRLRGDGTEGVGEDVTYDAEDQVGFQQAGPPPGLAGTHTIASFSELLEGMADYRRWGFESAALDLALRQRGLSLHETLRREPQPVRFVVSTRLGADGAERLRRLPGTRFKLDPTSDWDESLVADLAELDCVDVVDFKEAYTWREPERAAPPALYRLVVESLPDALIEDPRLDDPEKASALEPHRDRITWDAVIHSVGDVDALPFPPGALNSKPSRFGSLRRLLDFYDACGDRGIRLYGGGQFELGPGRGQIQYLASLFHPDGPNDVAPVGYNEVAVPAGLPTSPLVPAPDPTGFRWLQA